MRTSNTKFSISLILAALLVSCLTACGPTYVQSGGMGYDQGYVQPIYNPGLALVFYNGQQGYWNPGHTHFYTNITVNGASGYYDESHHFVSNSPAIQQAARSNKPFYTGASSSSLSTSSTANKTNVTNNTTVNKFGLSGQSGRGSAQVNQPPAAPTSRFGLSGQSGRGSASGASATPSSSSSLSTSSRAASPAPVSRPSGLSGSGGRRR